jgi:predicted permease
VRRLLRWAASIFRSRRALDADLRDEFAFHLDARTEALSRQGLTPEAARRQARMEFGSLPAYQDQTREATGVKLVDDFCRDMQFGLRMLRRQPGTAIIIVLTLALGIGANTAIFSVIDAVLLRPLPVTDPNSLVLLSSEQGTETSNPPPKGVWTLFSSSAYDSLRADRLPFVSVAAFAGSTDVVAAQVLGQSGNGTPDDAIRLRAHLVSGNYFDVMGVSAAPGRALAPDDDRPEAAPVAVISNRCWRDIFHSDADIVGRVVKINRTAFTVVGVMAASFFGERVESAPDFWVPLARQPDIQLRESVIIRPDYYWLDLIGRLAPGQSRPAAEIAVTAALRQFLTANAGSSIDETARARIQSARVAMVSGARGISIAREQDARPLTLLLIAAGLVLLVACANVATLLLCRATARGTEVGVRQALGASRARLVRQWLTESALLAAMGAASGMFIAFWTAPALQAFFPSGPVAATINGTVLAFTTGIMVIASTVFGLAPSLKASRVDTLAALRSTGRGTARRRRAFGATDPFVIAQIAVSLVLVFGATLFVRTLLNLEREPLGFDRDNVLLVRINPRVAGYAPADVGGLYRRLYDRVAAVPGVEHVTFARYSPFSHYFNRSDASVEGYTPAPGEDLLVQSVEVGPDYPQTLGMPILSGRAIGVDDGAGAAPVAMVNEAFVRRFFPASSPLGHHVQMSSDYEIVGVVGDALFHSARDQMIPFVFVPMLQQTSQSALDCEIELRTRGDASGLAPAVRQVVAETDSRVIVTRAQTLHAQVLATFESERVAAGFVGLFASLALLLAAVGLYGVVSHSVVRRTKEMGVRIALGAAGPDIVWLIVRETLIWLGIGLTAGAVASALAGRLVASQLFGVTPRDLTSLSMAAAILVVIAMVASLIPATRAIRIHPTVALRAD